MLTMEVVGVLELHMASEISFTFANEINLSFLSSHCKHQAGDLSPHVVQSWPCRAPAPGSGTLAGYGLRTHSQLGASC